MARASTAPGGKRPNASQSSSGTLPEVPAPAALHPGTQLETPQPATHLDKQMDDMVAHLNPKLSSHTVLYDHLVSVSLIAARKFLSPESSRQDFGAFQSFPDYTLHNTGCHDNFRQDTFKTPTNHRKPFAKKSQATSDKKWAPLEGVTMNDLLWICDQTFVKTAHQLADHLVRQVEEQMTVAMDMLRREVTGPLETSCRAIKESLDDFQTSFGAIVNHEVEEVMGPHTSLTTSALKNLQVHVSDSMQTLQEDINKFSAQTGDQLQKSAGEMQLEFSTQHRLLAEVSDQILQERKDVKDALSVLAENVLKRGEEQYALQKELKKHTTDQLQIHLQEHSSRLPFNEVLGAVASNHGVTMQNFQQVHARISDLQSAQDALRTVSDSQSTAIERIAERPSGGLQCAPDAEMDTMGVQTDPPSLSDAWLQTGDELMKKPKKVRQHASEIPQMKEDPRPAAEIKKKSRPLQGPVFASESIMKKGVRQAMIKPQFSITDLYHTTGWAQYIAKHAYFEAATAIVVFLNVIWLAVDIDLNDEEVLVKAGLVFQVTENVFCAFFVLEWLIRLFALKKKLDGFKDVWFVLDFILALLMVFDTWVLTLGILMLNVDVGLINSSFLRLVRVVKIIRLSRVARILRKVPELVIIVKAISTAFRSFAVIAAFVTLIVYAWAISLRQLTAGTSTGGLLFRSVPQSMNTLLLDGMLSDYAEFINELTGVSAFLWPVGMMFVLLSAVTLMYMLIGVMVNVTTLVASTEREGFTVAFLANNMRNVLSELGYPAEHPFSKEEFRNLILHPDVVRLLGSIDVDILIMLDAAEAIWDDFNDKETRGFVFSDVVEAILSLRSENTATVQDIKGGLRNMKMLMTDQHRALMNKLSRDIGVLKQRIQDLQESEYEED